MKRGTRVRCKSKTAEIVTVVIETTEVIKKTENVRRIVLGVFFSAGYAPQLVFPYIPRRKT